MLKYQNGDVIQFASQPNVTYHAKVMLPIEKVALLWVITLIIILTYV